MKKLVLAEKPSVGREIAKVLGCNIRGNGWCEGDDYVITWALGHLVELAEPAHYSERYRRWSFRDLPMLPEELDLTVIDDVRDQFETVKSLFGRSDIDEFIIATDAGREGELVARWIMKMCNWTGPVRRLWISSQTEAAILDGFRNLQDGDRYLNLYDAAQSRAAADWYVGMNVTRALTCHYDAKLSAGRVQTPTLALLTRREDEIDAFEGRFYWTIKGDFGTFSASLYTSDDSIRIKTEAEKDEIEKRISGQEGVVESIVAVDRNEEPPLLYDLTELQRDANIQLGFSAKETLDVLQRLYEVHKIVTYPRTDSRYLTADIIPTLGPRLKALFETPFGPKAAAFITNGIREDKSRIVNDALVSDHHALIPTEMKVDLSKLNEKEKNLWELIVIRFLEALSQDYTYRTTTLTADVAGEKFRTRLTVPSSQGYRDIARSVGKRSAINLDDDFGFSTAVLSMKEGDRVKLESFRTRKMSTPAPERYNDATLLSAMEHAGRFVDDADLKRNLANGLGTPATRADIIEKLIQNHYVERDGKELVPTPKGREVVRLAPELLRNPELTGEWEARLSDIVSGTGDKVQFIKDIKKLSADLVKQVDRSDLTYSPHFIDSKKCPYCGSDMMKVLDEDGSVHYICQKLSCSYHERIVRRIKQSCLPAVRPRPASAAASPAKPKIVLRKKSDGTVEKKKVVVVARKREPLEFEEVVEVVAESKLNRYRQTRTERHEDVKSRFLDDSSTSGGTFADFLKQSQEREKRKKHK